MTHAIVHPRVSAVADGADPTLIKPSDWNASHSINWGFATPNASVITSAMADVAGDAYFDKVALLLHCNGADLSTTFVDNSPTPKTVSVAGAAKIRTNADGVNPKFGSGKGTFDGINSNLSIPTSADFDLGTEYTIEFWVFPTQDLANTNFGLIHRGFYTSGAATWAGLAFSIRHLAPGGIRFYFYGVTNATEQVINSSSDLIVNQWNHVAMCRAGTNGSAFINGTSVGTISGLNTPAVSTQTLRVGVWDYSANAEFFAGHMDDIRVTKGLARYTANFTPHAIAHYDSFPGVNLQAGKNYTSTGPIEIQDTDVNIPNGTEWVIV